MKKIAVFLFASILAVTTFAINPIAVSEPKAEDVMVPLFGTEQKISLAQFVKLSPADYQSIAGQKLNLKEKLSLKILQHHLKKAINKDGTVNMEKFQKMAGDTSFHLGWFALGFFLGLIGLIIALVINDDKRRGRIKWTAIGLGAAVVLVLLLSLL